MTGGCINLSYRNVAVLTDGRRRF